MSSNAVNASGELLNLINLLINSHSLGREYTMIGSCKAIVLTIIFCLK